MVSLKKCSFTDLFLKKKPEYVFLLVLSNVANLVLGIISLLQPHERTTLAISGFFELCMPLYSSDTSHQIEDIWRILLETGLQTRHHMKLLLLKVNAGNKSLQDYAFVICWYIWYIKITLFLRLIFLSRNYSNAVSNLIILLLFLPKFINFMINISIRNDIFAW